jgi:hypothetical protein
VNTVNDKVSGRGRGWITLGKPLPRRFSSARALRQFCFGRRSEADGARDGLPEHAWVNDVRIDWEFCDIQDFDSEKQIEMGIVNFEA